MSKRTPFTSQFIVDRRWTRAGASVRPCGRSSLAPSATRFVQAVASQRHSGGLCRERLAVTLKSWSFRRAGLLAPLVRAGKKVDTFLIDLCSTVAPHDFASNNPTTHWDGICKDTFAFLLALCVKYRLKLLIQSGDVRQRLSNLYSAHGLKEHRLPPGPASVMRRFTLPIEVPSISKEAVQLAVHAVGHPSGFLTYDETVAITRYEVCTPPATPRHGFARLRAPGLVGHRPGFLCRPRSCGSACRSSSGACSTMCSTLS